MSSLFRVLGGAPAGKPCPSQEFPHPRVGDAVENHRPLALVLDVPVAPQDREVSREGGLGDTDVIEHPAHALPPLLGQDAQDLQPDGVSQVGEEARGFFQMIGQDPSNIPNIRISEWNVKCGDGAFIPL